MPARKRGAVAESARLDELDRALIEALQNDGRASFRHIARRLGVAEGTIRHRYERLADASVLEVVGVTSPRALGFEAMAMVGVTTDGRSRAVAEAAAEIDEVSYAVVVAGRFDLLVELVCRDQAHLLDVLERLAAVEGVRATDTFVYLQLAKQSYEHGHLPSAADGA